MGQSAGKPPSAPDPSTILGLQNQYNRYNTQTPFGSTGWSMGANGHETQTTNLSPQMQDAMNRAFSAAATPYQKEYVPQGMDQLASGVLGRVGSHYGLSGSGLNTNLQQQKPQQGSPNPPQGMGGMSGMGLQTQGSPGAAQLQSMAGANGGGMGGMGLQMGGGGGFSGADPSAAMAALQGGGMGGMGLQTQQPGQQGGPQPMPMPGMSGMGIGMQQPGVQIPGQQMPIQRPGF